MTLREALQLPAFREARAQVLAGEANLDRTVRWVHVAELADIAYLLNGGELLLTTGMGLVRDGALRRRYVNELAEAGLAGLVVELGRNFREMPPEMVEEAERRALPLIALRCEIRYVDVTEQVHRAIISRQYELVRTVEEVSRDFTDLILGGAGVPEIARHLCQVVGRPVVVENAAHQVVDCAALDSDEVPPILAAWEAHSRTGHREGQPGRVHREPAPACAWAGIWLRHGPWGRVHLLGGGAPDDERIGLILDRAGAALGLALLAQKDVAHLSDRAGSALISDLLAGRYASGKEILRRALSLGADLSSGQLAAVVAEPGNLAAMAEQHGLTEEERQRVRMRIASHLRESIADLGCAGLVGVEGDRALAVVAVPGSRGLAAVLDQLADRVRRGVARTDEDLSLLLGASRQTQPGSLRRAFEEAGEAVAFGRRSGRDAAIFHFGDLGTYHLLLRLAAGPELAAFVESELSPLLDHDARSNAKLLPTLRAYLDNACRKSDTVKALWIQRRTLYGRLGRIEALLRRSLDDQDTRTRLTLALQGLDLLRQRANAARRE